MRGTHSVHNTATTACPDHLGACSTDDLAESKRSEIPIRSLLDRLLDEAEALHSADAVPRGEHEMSSSNRNPERAPSVLHQRADAARRAFSRADALIALAQGYLRGDRPNRAPIEITLTIAASSLHSGPADPVEVGEMGESFVSREAARRLSCDGGVVEVVEGEHGAPLSVGRKRRTIAGALKRALRKRDTACTYPGCTIASSWKTNLGWPRIRAMNEPLAIDADTIACEWDGTRPDYGTIIGHFVVADGLQ